MPDSNAAQAPVLFREQVVAGGLKLGFAGLNAEKSLNALTLPMIRALDAQLQAWAGDADIACVVLHGAGEKAFCAGGDVRSLRDAALAHRAAPPDPVALEFFSREYRLDYRIHTYPKPILLWGSGIVMGGGLGLMAGASHRVVTETSRIAMPEITIGLYPDVGGSWFLQRMPGRSGLFLALTGASMNAHDAQLLGIADHFVKSADRAAIFDALAGIAWQRDAAANRLLLSRLLRSHAAQAAALLPASNLLAQQQTIEDLTDGDTLAEVAQRIAAYAGGDAWMKRAAAALGAGSPTSAALIWEIRQRAKHLSLADVFRMELIVSLQCCAHPDFAEGVRALLIDKDGKPQWTPPTAAAVTRASIGQHFVAPQWPQAVHPLADLASP